MKKQRDSNIELLRILMMIVIVAHHYIVNSGITQMITPPPFFCGINSFNVYFALLFGWGGKTAINVFVLITGYFMCRQEFKWKKVLFLAAEVVFYRWTIAGIFLASGYEPFSLKECVKILLVIPFINRLIQALDKKQLERLLITLLVLFTGFSTFCFNSSFEYVGWYVTVYLAGSYIRLYELRWMQSRRTVSLLCAGMLFLSWLSVAGIWYASNRFGRMLPYYYFVSDSNKILAAATAVFLFLFFKNIKIGTSKVINTLAASTFGVLMIHASSDTMRRWLWQDVCKNVEAFASDRFVLHAVGCTLAVYAVCVCIDIARKLFTDRMLRIFNSKLHFSNG